MWGREVSVVERVASRPRSPLAEQLAYARQQARTCAGAIVQQADPTEIGLLFADTVERLAAALEAIDARLEAAGL